MFKFGVFAYGVVQTDLSMPMCVVQIHHSVCIIHETQMYVDTHTGQVQWTVFPQLGSA